MFWVWLLVGFLGIFVVWFVWRSWSGQIFVSRVVLGLVSLFDVLGFMFRISCVEIHVGFISCPEFPIFRNLNENLLFLGFVCQDLKAWFAYPFLNFVSLS